MSRIMITGGDGYLGRRIARALLAEPDHALLLHVRAAERAEFEAKHQALTSWLGPVAEARTHYHWGDLRNDAAFDGIDPGSISRIVHSAAITRLNVEQVDAQQVNVEGTRRMLEFARGCPNLDVFAYLSSVYASGLQAGTIEEGPLLGEAGFANHYEASKYAAEQLVTGEYDSLPWRIMRTVTTLADNESGTVGQFNAIHNTLKLFHYGLLSLMPGRPDTPVYMVEGDLVADAVARLLFCSEHRDVFHCCHARDASLTLGELLDVVYACFREDEKFRRANIPQPLFCELDSFETLGRGVQQFAGSVVNQALGSVAPFAAQLFIDKDIRNDRMRAALPDYRPTDFRKLLQATCQHLMATRFGKQAAA